ncbi:MAG: endo-1,4-beta-xylanase [Gammaproteobacteria bacterium]|nr:endo-1,4-beta-xylanase [Gammaproteobacteria bacterium]
MKLLSTSHDRSLSLTGLALSACLLTAGCGGGDDGGDPSTDGGSSDGGDGTLSTLPQPPLTAAPGTDDEPIAENPEFNTAQDFEVRREPGARLPEEMEVELTDADFEAGVPEPVLQIPDSIDPSSNQPPFFEGLTNLDVLAGDIVEIVYLPQDPEGGLPGMFPQELPQGATFTDNFDGSKTFTWQPLQMDVGVREFTVVAIDPENDQYRSSNSILIRTTLPDDPSSIPNVAPMLDEMFEYTARVNDPVVIRLKGVDLNGSVPTVEIPDLPAGASINQDPRFEEIFALKFTPVTAGEFSIDVVIRDSVDTSLTSTETVSVTVLDNIEFERTGARLRQLSANRGIKFGFASLQSFYHQPDGAIYADIAASEFDIVTPENSMKMDYINPLPGRFQFAASDNLVRFAQLHNIDVHGHPLVWYRQVPQWVEDTPAADREIVMREYIDRMLMRYAQAASVWDVVNEPMADDGTLRDSVWFEAMGERYIDVALRQARLSAPNATLLINEFDIASGAKANGLIALIDRLQQREVPLDGIGFQLHLFSSFDQYDELQTTFASIASRDLDIYITELDISVADGATSTEQADAYRRIVDICLNQTRCKAIQMWGFTDQYSFRTIFDPLPFDRAYQAKPAYYAIQDALSN